MNNQTLNIINRATSQKSVYDILTFDTHERYQTQLAKTGHNFYAFKYDGCKDWVDTYSPKPPNYYTLPKNTLVNGINFDFILSQSKFGQFQVSQQLAKILKIPIVSLEHTLPLPHWTSQQLQDFRGMRGDFNIFISEYSADAWGIKPYDVIKHSIDTEVFRPLDSERQPIVLSVVNDFKNRDYCCNYSGWQRITKDLPAIVVGDNPGMSVPARSVDDLVEKYNRSQVFLNTSTISPVPTSLLEAMACGCAVVSTANCMIPEVIVNGVNGFISNDEGELRMFVQSLLENEELRNKLGAAARQTILCEFSESEFINRWNNIFNLAYGVTK